MMCGGFGQVNNADESTVAMCNEIKPKIEAHLNAKYDTFEPVSYTTQVVAGTNYKIKVKVGDSDYIHIKIHKPLPCNGTELVVMDASSGHSLDSAL